MLGINHSPLITCAVLGACCHTVANCHRVTSKRAREIPNPMILRTQYIPLDVQYLSMLSFGQDLYLRSDHENRR